MTNTVTIYADGACKKNPGPGGWGIVLQYKDTEKHLFGGEPSTTNNRMELMAVIKGLESLKRPCNVKVHSDSMYVINGMKEWINNWKKKNWKNVKNVDLWQQLDSIQQLHNVEWIWVRGHSGIYGNTLADRLANYGVNSVK